ncbi:hypothetical protein CFter6_3841 [Collimonas fungivorans]|uniref:Uncharacterized protein n=1 Tax=Collimonas fungivorans TaxID=158899 RepID=A0A127PGB8_9BURK|nr:hypothetical protein CFter6_3841 [Collimonas fungivorans]
MPLVFHAVLHIHSAAVDLRQAGKDGQTRTLAICCNKELSKLQ